jgi:hypothetical protein
MEVAARGGVFVQLGGITVQAASVGCITEPGLVGGEGVIGCCGPEACWGELALPVSPAVLIEVIRELVQRRTCGAGLVARQLLTAVRETGPAWAGSARARTDASQRPADTLARQAV